MKRPPRSRWQRQATGSFAAHVSLLIFAVLCWNSLEWNVLRLQIRQTQFKAIALCAAWMAGLVAVENTLATGDVVFALVDAFLRQTPLATVLLLDAVKDQAKVFRVGMPLLFATHVGARVYHYGFAIAPDDSPHITLSGTNVTALSHDLTSQYATSLASATILLGTYLWNLVRDPSQAQVCFPVRHHVLRGG